MPSNTEKLRTRIIKFRKQLTKLEIKRAAFENDVPPALWNELVDLSRQLEEAEQEAALTAAKIADEVNLVRENILIRLDTYQR